MIRIGFSGRICEQKRPDIFLQVAKEATAQIPGIQFVWIGDGELRSQLEETWINRNGKHKIEVTGWIQNVESRVKTLDIFLSTSAYEAFGYSALEAVYLRVPCVLSHVAGHIDLITHGKTGFLAKRPEDFLKYLTQLAQNRELRTQLANTAFEQCSKMFSLSQMVEKTHELYQELLHPKKAGGSK